MTKINNYSAWQVNTKSIDDDTSETDLLKLVAEYAVLAPSGHNTQPWYFKFNDDSVAVSVNHERELPHSGKVAAEPFVSIGSCVETFVQAAKGFGYLLKIQPNFKNSLKINISIDKKTTPDPSILDSIINRVSNREKLKPIKDVTVVESLIKSNLNFTSTKLIYDKNDIQYIADKTSEATVTIMKDPEFRKELSKWVRNNVTKKYDGMPAFAQGMPTPPSLIAKRIIRIFDVSKTQAKKDAQRVVDSGGIILINLDRTTNEAFFNLGRQYAKICILAQQNGLATSGVGAAVIETSTKAEIKDYFGLKSIPSAIIRIGIPTKKVKHTPRLTVEMVTKN
jgi:hypothetical protein